MTLETQVMDTRDIAHFNTLTHIQNWDCKKMDGLERWPVSLGNQNWGTACLNFVYSLN
jgi:hypothetical protein